MEIPHFKPLIASAGEIEALQALVESRALIHREGLFPKKIHRFVTLIIARLAGNPNFEALAQQMQRGYERGQGGITEKLQRLIDHLRDQAAPAA